MGDKISRLIRTDRNLANGQPLAELERPALTDQVRALGLAQEVEREIGGGCEPYRSDVRKDGVEGYVRKSDHRRAEIVHPGLRCASLNKQRRRELSGPTASTA
jgi:hypothetical protein